MKHFFILLLTGVLLLTACSAPKDIEVHSAWVRPTAKGENAGVYFTLHNHSDQDDELIGASSTAADVVEIHESKMENDVMTMNMIESLPLKAGEEVTFESGGLHMMLINIKQELVLGEHIGITLHFKNHEDIIVNVHIEDSMPGEDHGHE
ncbi:MAG: copper chaperone PCu(A)C [Anaerolineales bacterium]|nr:copper chaperone PCu(A)C [Anaerolineales bacterium]